MRRLLVILFATLPHLVLGQGSPSLAETAVVRLDSPIDFDGQVGEAEWGHVPTLPLTLYSPVYGGTMTLRTELRLAFDSEYVYFSAKCFEPSGPTMTTFRRDAWSGRDDQVAVAFDTFDDHQNASIFVLFATGARVDAQLGNDGRQMQDMNIDWNTFWDARVNEFDGGWEGEMRIPVSSLRFETPSDGSPVQMGVAAYRYSADANESQNYPDIAPDWGFWSFVKPSKMDRRTFSGIESSKPVYIAPYVTGGLGQNFDLNDAETEYVRSDNPTYDVGLDLKYSLTSNLTLDATLNTDFAQVEADDQQVNLTRFSLFFPEKRQFFLERTSNFDFSFGGFDRVFYSRRVGLSDGKEVRLLGGGRLVGRVGGWDLGLLNLQTGTDGDADSENFGVVRIKRSVGSSNSYVGGIAASRVSVDGAYNMTYGMDTQYNLRGDDYLLVNWAQSFETDAENQVSALDNSRIRLQLQRARNTGFNYDIGYGRSGAAYNPAAGFQLRDDYSQLSLTTQYGVRPSETSPIESWAVSATGGAFYRNEDGSLESGLAELGVSLSNRTGYRGGMDLILSREDLREGFELSDDAEVLAGRYDFLTARAEWGTPGGNRLEFGGNVLAGRFYDGRQIVVNLNPILSVSPKVALTGGYQYNRIRFPDRDEQFDAHVVRLRTDLMLNTRVTFSTFVQYVSSSDALIANARFRYNPRDGNDFFLVWNEAINTDRFAVLPELPFSSSRTLIAKYTYTLSR